MSFLNILGGHIIKASLDWIKTVFLHKSEVNRAKEATYKELAEYIADVEWVVSGNSNYEFWNKMNKKQPTFPVLTWYQSHKLDLFLRIDKKGGIRSLQRSIVEEYERIKTQGNSIDPLAEAIPLLVQRHQNDLDVPLLHKYIAEVNASHHKSIGLAA